MSRAPAGSLRANVLLADLAGLVVVLLGAWSARRWLGVGAAYPAIAAMVFVAGMAAAWPFVVRHHPFDRFGPANQITTLRAALIALIAGFVFEPATSAVAAAATATAVAVAGLDGVDGWMARRTRMSSAFGARFDVEADSLFILALSVLLWRHQKTGAWVLAGGLYRYGFVAAGSILPWMARPLGPTNRGRVVAACHMLGLTVALAPIVSPTVATAGVAATLAALSWSFAVDVRRLWRGDTK